MFDTSGDSNTIVVAEHDLVQLQLDCEGRTLTVTSSHLDFTISNLPAGQQWVPMVCMYAPHTCIEAL